MDQTVEQPPIDKAWIFEDGTHAVSLNSRFAVNMCFTNRTEFEVDALWLNFEGKEISYGRIKPGATHLLYTYLTHPWVFRSLANPKEALIVHGKPVAWPNQTQTFADITEAPFLPWNPATHASAFRDGDPAFARDVRNLLLTYHVQRKAKGRSCDVVGRRGGAAGKSRRGSTGGIVDTDASPNKAAVHCCGVQLWHWRGLEGCNALHTAPTHSMLAPARKSGTGAAPPTTTPTPSSSSTPATPSSRAESAGQHRPQPEDGLLGQLPFDIILEIIAKMAPKLRDYHPVLKDDMEMMPLGVEPAKGPVAHLAARMLGPVPPEAPVAEPEAWFAAVDAGAIAGAPQIFGELGALMAQGGPLAPPVAIPQPPLQPQPAADQPAAAPAAAAAAAALPPHVAEIMLYTQAAVLANTAMSHAPRMAMQQEAQGQALWRLLQAQVQAAANTAAQQQQEQGNGAEADQQEGAGSEYGDADGDDELDEQEGENGGDGGPVVVFEGDWHGEGAEANIDDGEGGDDEGDVFEDAGDLWAGSGGQA